MPATVTSLTGWVAIGLPAMVLRDGFPVAPLALSAIAIPMAGTLFLKRQWMVSRRFGYVTPVEVLAGYFGGRLIRPVLLLIALVFALPFLGIQLAATGFLVQVLSDGAISAAFAMWVLTAAVFLYVCLGGMRAATFVGVLQGLLFVTAVVAVGVIAWSQLGGFTSFMDLLAKLGASKLGVWGASTAGYNAAFETPGVVQFVGGLGREDPVGGLWTASMVLSTGVGLMGLQLAPALAVASFATRDTKGFGPQQVWIAGAAVGLLLVSCGIIAGMGAQFLGGSSALVEGGLAATRDLRGLEDGHEGGLVAAYIRLLGEHAPWFAGLLGVGAVAATQVTAAIYASGTGTIFARDFYRHYINPEASDRQQRFFGQVGVGLTLLGALLGATFAPEVQAQIGTLALAFGAQLLPAMAALCWFDWLTRRAVLSGLIAGLVAAAFTDRLGITLAGMVGIELPWGRWPWTIHAAGWGLACNVALCLVVSLLTQKMADRTRRHAVHGFFAEADSRRPVSRGLRSVAWAVTIAWFFLALGPGLVFGTDLFGAPNGGVGAWLFAIPSLWAWTVLGWAVGVLILWFMAYRLGLSEPPSAPIEPEIDSIRRPARTATTVPLG